MIVGLLHGLSQAKDQAYVKERIEHTRSDKEKEVMKNELMRIKKLVSTAEVTMKNYQAEVCFLPGRLVLGQLRASPHRCFQLMLPGAPVGG